MFVTDRPEWNKRTERVPTSFEHRIVQEAVIVAEGEPGPVGWDKPVPRPSTSAGEALRCPGFVDAHLSNLLRFLQIVVDPPTPTFPERLKGEPADRVHFSCYIVYEIVQQSVMTLVYLGGRLHHHQPGVRLGYDLHELCDLLIEPHRTRIRDLLNTRTAQQLTRWNQARIDVLRPYPEPADPRLVARYCRTATTIVTYTAQQFDTNTEKANTIGRHAKVIQHLAATIGSFPDPTEHEEK